MNAVLVPGDRVSIQSILPNGSNASRSGDEKDIDDGVVTTVVLEERQRVSHRMRVGSDLVDVISTEVRLEGLASWFDAHTGLPLAPGTILATKIPTEQEG